MSFIGVVKFPCHKCGKEIVKDVNSSNPYCEKCNLKINGITRKYIGTKDINRLSNELDVEGFVVDTDKNGRILSVHDIVRKLETDE